MTLSVNDFTAGDVITASAMNTNFATIEGYVNSSPGLAQLTGATFSGAVTFSAGLTSTGGTTALGTTNVTGAVTVGVDDTGHDVKFFGASASHYMLWDEANDALVLTQDSGIYFYDLGGEKIQAASNGHLNIDAGTTLDLTAPTIDLNASTKVNVDGIVDITDATDASDATGDTGALRCEGGASIAKKLYVGTDLDVDGTANFDGIVLAGNMSMTGDVSGANPITKMTYVASGSSSLASHTRTNSPAIFVNASGSDPTSPTTGDIWIGF